MTPTVPDFILEQDALGRTQGAFEGAALRVTLLGFAKPLEEMYERRVPAADSLRSLFEPLLAAVERSGGFVAGFAPGHAFTAIFPDAPDRDAAAHVLAAVLELRRSLRQSSERRDLTAGYPVSFRMGVAWGPVNWEVVRISKERAYFRFFGVAVGASNTLEAEAQRGDVLVDRAMRERLPSASAQPTADGFHKLGELEMPDLPAAPLKRSQSDSIDAGRDGGFRVVTTVALFFDQVTDTPALVRLLDTAAERHGGTLGWMDAGDERALALVHFGASTTAEDDNDRALDLTLELKGSQFGPARVATGVARGVCFAGHLGPGRDRACLGRTPNLAAQLARKAPLSAIWVNEQVYRASEASHQWTTENIFRFEGFSLPILVYSLERRRVAVQVEFYELGPIGREREISDLADALSPILRGEPGGIVHLEGDAGMGKTYLAERFRSDQAAAGRDLLWLEARCTEAQRPLGALEHAARAYTETRSALRSEERLAGLDRALRRLLERLPHDREALRSGVEGARAALSALLERGAGEADQGAGGAEPPSPAAAAGPTPEAAAAAIASVLVAESALRPAVLHVEDLHWADEATLAAIGAIARACQGSPVAILCASRPVQGTARLQLDAAPRVIALGALSQDTIVEMSEPFFGGPLPNMLAALLGETAGGNPFFAQEILAYWLEDGRFGSSASSRSNRFMPPRTLTTLIVSRFERLESRLKQIVLAAAALGREIDTRLLARVVDDSSTLAEHLHAGDAQRIWTRVDEHLLEFTSVLLLDAARSMMPAARREELSRRVAEAKGAEAKIAEAKGAETKTSEASVSEGTAV